MDALTRLALVGTAQNGDAEASGALVDAVLARLSSLPLERRVLLAGGARAAASMAGHKATRSEDAFLPCPPETRAACSTKAARLIGDFLQGRHEPLLPEALALLDRARLRLPASLLPAALGVRGDELQAAMRLVLGERGAWLARLNPSWAWAASGSAASKGESLDELERAWVDATPAARRSILGRARAIDGGRARAWLEAAWTTEKADERAALLAVLREGLSPEDEAFVEAQLGDRSAAVREAARALLGALPGSAFVRRMTERADAMIDFKRAASIGEREGSLAAEPPTSVDGAADRDGLLAKPPAGVGSRAFWLTRAVAAVPVDHWTRRFDAPAGVLVGAARATDWAAALCDGWMQAALAAGATDWLCALWDFWRDADDKVAEGRSVTVTLARILRALPPAEAAARVEPLLADAPSRIGVVTALGAVPAPWPETLGVRWLAMARRDLRRSSPRAVSTAPSLAAAARSLPAACFEAALEPFDDVDDDWLGRQCSDFHDVVRLRRDLFQEIVP